VTAGMPWLDVPCPGCRTRRAIDIRKIDRHPRPRSAVSRSVIRSFCCLGYCEVKIVFGIMPWMPLVPSTTWVT
jgi:hypothetical protein